MSLKFVMDFNSCHQALNAHWQKTINQLMVSGEQGWEFFSRFQLRNIKQASTKMNPYNSDISRRKEEIPSQFYVIVIFEENLITHFKYGRVIFFIRDGCFLTNSFHSSWSILPSPLESASPNVCGKKTKNFRMSGFNNHKDQGLKQ